MSSHRSSSVVTAVAVAVAIMSPWRAEPAGQTPAVADRTWQPTRLSDGQPDIQGFWDLVPEGTFALYSLEGKVDAGYQLSRPSTDPARTFRSAIVDPADGKIPYQPWAAEVAKDHFDHFTSPQGPQHLDTRTRCYLPGVPRHSYDAIHQFIQTPGYVLMMTEFNHAYRTIPLDGRPHVGAGIRLWQGDARGRWEGNTLIVESANFNDRTWFDVVGSFHSDALRVVERWTLVSADRIDYTATIEDPKVFTKPWKVAFTLARNTAKNYQLLEFACREGNK